MVYIREAHASDVWQDPDNVSDNVVFASPRDYNQRAAMGQMCVAKLGIQMPAVIDGFDNSTERAYTAWPDRMYLIDRDGKVVFKSPPGPFGFKTKALEEAIDRLEAQRR